MMHTKFIIFLIIIIAIMIPFANSYSIQSIDELAYLVAIGIEKGENNNYIYSFEFTIANSSGEGTSGEASPTILNKIESSSLSSAITLMNNYVSKQINLSHCKAVVISEDIATDGISDIVFTLMNNSQIRPDTNIIISKCSANEFIKNAQPMLENLVSEYYEITPLSSEYTGYTSYVKLGDFFNDYSSSTSEPTAILRISINS